MGRRAKQRHSTRKRPRASRDSRRATSTALFGGSMVSVSGGKIHFVHKSWGPWVGWMNGTLARGSTPLRLKFNGVALKYKGVKRINIVNELQQIGVDT